MGVAQHGGRAEPGAGEPGENGLRTVFKVMQHAVAGANAARRKPTRNPRDGFGETREDQTCAGPSNGVQIKAGWAPR
jgi:hypothetical protein